MLFRKKIERSCLYCSNSAKLNDDQMLCTKRGVVGMDRACRKFRYDPFKRVPPRPKALNLTRYEEDDFTL